MFTETNHQPVLFGIIAVALIVALPPAAQGTGQPAAQGTGQPAAQGTENTQDRENTEVTEGTGSAMAEPDETISNPQPDLSARFLGQDVRFESALAYVVSDDAILLSFSVNPDRCEDAFAAGNDTDERMLLRLARPWVGTEPGWRITFARYGSERMSRDLGPTTFEIQDSDGVQRVLGAVSFEEELAFVEGSYSAVICPAAEDGSSDSAVGRQSLLAVFGREQVVFRSAIFETQERTANIRLSTSPQSCGVETPSDLLLDLELGGVGGDEVDIIEIAVGGHRIVRPISLSESTQPIGAVTQIGGRRDPLVQIQIGYTFQVLGRSFQLNGLIQAVNCDL